MNPAEDRLIEVVHSVDCEEHDPLRVFDLAKEYRDKLIPRNISASSAVPDTHPLHPLK